MSQYQTIQVGGDILEFPADMSDDEIAAVLKDYKPTSEAPQGTPVGASPEAGAGASTYQSPYGPIREDIDHTTLTNDPDWLHAAKVIHKLKEGTNFEGTPEELSNYALDVMGWFNYNLPAMTYNTNLISDSTQEQKDAFLYLMDTYDNVNVSWGGVGRALKGIAADPTTYTGLATLGFGTAAAQGGKQLTKMGVKEMLKAGMRTGTVAAIEGGLYAAVDNSMRQEIRVAAGQRQEQDMGELAKSALVGAGVGFVAGTALDVAVSSVAKAFRKEDPVVTDALSKLAARTEGDAPTPKTDTPEATPTVTPEADTTNVASKEVTEEVTEGVTASGVAKEAEVEPSNPLVKVEETPEAAAKDFEGYFKHVTLDDLNLTALKTSVPYTRQAMQDVVNRALGVEQQLRGLHFTQLEDLSAQLQTGKMTVAEFQELSMGTKLARDAASMELAVVTKQIQKESAESLSPELIARQQELTAQVSRLMAMDEAFGSHFGLALRQRQEGLQLEKGLNPEDSEEFALAVTKAYEDVAVKKAREAYSAPIQESLKKGDLGEAGRLMALRELETGGHLYNKMNEKAGWSHRLSEVAISNVFSSTTLMVNIIPSGAKVLYRPLVDAVVNNPFSAATRKEMAATYGAMRASVGGAFKAAVAAFRYEQALLTRDGNKFSEGNGLVVKGIKGGVLRTIPRLLNASDEFLSHITYQGFIAGQAAGEAYENGMAQGLKGAKLDKFVKAQVKEKMSKAYDRDLKNTVDVIAAKGINLNLKGEKLASYVKAEIQKLPDSAMRYGTDEVGLDYVRDMLFKRKFSGEGMASTAALKYEEVVNKYPVFKLMGQLFFRTPVRVFEEGIRLTPALQFVAPNFIADLKGVNGKVAQTRANGEALLSLGITGAVLMSYAQGHLHGSGAYEHWKQEQNRRDGSKPEPYTIKFDDGSTWNFRNFDPFATAAKIIVNAFERYEDLMIRQRQGEFIGQDAFDKVMATITVGTGAIAQSIRDANLAAGVDGWITLFETAGDSDERALLKFTGERLGWMVPNTLHKIAKENDPELRETADVFDMVENRLINPLTLGLLSKNAPKSYDYLGNPRRHNDAGELWSMTAVVRPEDRWKGREPADLEILDKLDYISKQTGVIFTAPYRHPLAGKIDLRTKTTSDGEETYYDRWQRYYKQAMDNGGKEALRSVLNAGLPVGTREVNGPVVQAATKIVSKMQTAAMARLLAEEDAFEELLVKPTIKAGLSKGGVFDDFHNKQ